jgi:CBS domain-containing protein
MTREVVTVGPDTSAKHAGEVMAEHGFAALPVVDDDDRLVGIVAEADVLKDRLPLDPRLHMRRDEDVQDRPLPLLVRGVMTAAVRTVAPNADVADVARLLIDANLRSVPVVEDDRPVGIVSRRDLLRALVRPDDVLRHDVLRLVEGYTGAVDAWDVGVTEGVVSIRRVRGMPEFPVAVEQRALRALALTIPGVVGVQMIDDIGWSHPSERSMVATNPVDTDASV